MNGLLSMTTRRSLSIPVDLTREGALAAARAALTDLSWPLDLDQADRIVANEDQARIHCHCQPIKAVLTVGACEGDRVALLVQTSVPGRGPVSSQHLETQTGVLARRILMQIRN